MPASGRSDLGFMFDRLTRAMLRGETPILERHGLTMWEYAILGTLADDPARRQADLAERVGRDPTRLIAELDHLQDLGYVRRVADSADRRARIVSITRAGLELHASCQTAIRTMEDSVLSDLSLDDRTTFLRVLADLSARA